MYLIDVVPLAYLPKKDSQILTYFFKEPIKKGSLVCIPLRKKSQLAIVLNSEEVKKNKLNLKKSSFSIKPISKISIENFLPSYFLDFIKWLADFYIAPLSLVVFSILPKQKEFYNYLKAKSLSFSQRQKNKDTPSNKIPFPFQKEISETIKQNKQVLILVPTKIAGQALYNQIKKDFPRTIFYWQKTKKQNAAIWQLTAENKIKIIIGLQKSLFLPFKNLGLIIIFDASNKLHKNTEIYPYFDSRFIAKKLAQLTNAKLNNYFLEDNLLKNRPTIKIIDLKSEKSNNIFSQKIKRLLALKGKKWLFYTNRKGHSRYVVCKDCKRTINCPNCSVPLTLHKDSQNKPYLSCHHCGYQQEVPKRCPHCGGYMLEGKGIGSQKIAEFLPKNKTLIFDIDNLKNLSQEKKAIEQLKSDKINYIIATETILKWLIFLKNFFDYTVISLADSLLSFPYFNTSENFLLQLERLKFASKNVFIQTFNPDLPIFDFSKNLKSFLEKEDRTRKALGFPETVFSLPDIPESKMVKITVLKNSPQTAKEQALLAKKILQKSGLDVLGPSQSFIFKEKGFFRYELLIKLKSEKEKQIIKKIIPLKDWFIEVL